MTEPHPLTAWRKQDRRTLVSLADALGCAPSHLSQIESRKTNPSLALISKLKAVSGGKLKAEDFMPADSAPKTRSVVTVGKVKFGNALPLAIIAGPCVMEGREHGLQVATTLAKLGKKLKIGLVFKTSFDKANRTSARGARGVGLEEALPIFAEIRERTGLAVLTDVHEPEQCARVAEFVDVLQIPAFLCRQTDLLVAAAKTGRVVNVKKGQFLAPWDMKNVVDKITGAGNRNVLVTERGASFGYNTLVSDMRALPILARSTGAPVVFDATHSVQQPGGKGTASGGEREFVPVLARAAVAVGVAAVFIETHPDPDHAPSDGPNMVPLAEMERLLSDLIAFDKVAKKMIQPRAR
jgi:2-dehydro-3-deoxyphosphooctonate aldolase (KDO 8-P synthase)